MNRHVAPEKAVATPGKSRAPKNSTRAGAVRTNRIEARISPDGLAIVKRAVERMGGRVGFEPSRERGLACARSWARPRAPCTCTRTSS